MVVKHERKRGKVFVDQSFAGIIEQREGVYTFQYDEVYLRTADAKPVSLTLPLRAEPFVQKTMIAFLMG